MEDNNNKIIVIICLLLIVIVGVGIAVKLVFFSKSNEYLFLHESMIWEKNGKEWKQVKEVSDDVLKQTYTLYNENGQTKDISIKEATSGFYYFDKNYKQIKSKNLRGISNIKGIKFADYKKEFGQDSDNGYVKEALSQINVNLPNGYWTKKVTYDFDTDGQEETVYISSNYSFDIVDYQIYSVVYQVKDGQVTQIIDKAKDNQFDFFEILDVDNDGKYEMILTYKVKNLPGLTSCYKMYKLNNNKWETIKNCS